MSLNKDRRQIKKRARYFATSYFGYLTGVQLVYMSLIITTVIFSLAISFLWPMFFAFIGYPAVCGLYYFYLNLTLNRPDYKNIFAGFKRLNQIANTFLFIFIAAWLTILAGSLLGISPAVYSIATTIIMGIVLMFLPIMLMTEAISGFNAIKQAAILLFKNFFEMLITGITLLIYPLAIIVLAFIYGIGNSSEFIMNTSLFITVTNFFPSIGELSFTLSPGASTLIIFVMLVIFLYVMFYIPMIIVMYYVKFTQPNEFKNHNVLFETRKERESFKEKNDNKKIDKNNYVSNEGLQKGDIVVHAEFGEGKIIKIKADKKRNIELALVSFVNSGQKIIELTPGVLRKKQ